MRRHTCEPHLIESLEARSLLSVVVIDSSPNNRMRDAEIAQLDPTDGKALIVGQISHRDQDVYRLQVPATGELQLVLHDSGRDPVEVEGLTRRGRRIFETSGRNGASADSIHVKSGEVLFFQVKGSGRGMGSYQISLDEPSAISSTNPPLTVTPAVSGSSQTAPTPFTLNVRPTVLTGTIETPGGSDFYTFTAPTAKPISFSINTTGTTPLTLTVTDASGDVLLAIDSESSSGNPSISPVAGATYNIQITSDGVGPSPYSATVYQQQRLAFPT